MTRGSERLLSLSESELGAGLLGGVPKKRKDFFCKAWIKQAIVPHP